VDDYEIAVVQGDGIGPEVRQAAIDVVKAAEPTGLLRFVEYPAGAEEYRRSADAYPEDSFRGSKAAQAILHGAGGLPDVNYPDGVEAGVDFGLKTRLHLDLYANIRPIHLYAGVRHGDDRLPRVGRSIERVESAIADSRRYLTSDLGGSARTRDVVDGIVRYLERKRAGYIGS